MEPLGENFREYTTTDKSKWARGEWDAEPDKLQWIDAETGLDCLMVRTNHSGHWCGYVGVPPGHSLHGTSYDGVDVNVHGGLTFAEGCHDLSEAERAKGLAHVAAAKVAAATHPSGDSAQWLRDWLPVLHDHAAWTKRQESVAICHVAQPGRPDHVYWFGFDCAHYRDVCPVLQRYSERDFDSDYRNVAYVVDEVRSLARQLKALA